MAISTFDLFKIGIGPSSSHTVGPMKASYLFIEELKNLGFFEQIDSLSVELFGSLALTGVGHGTDKAIILGLMGEQPQSIEPDSIPKKVSSVQSSLNIHLSGSRLVNFDPKKHIIFNRKKTLPAHPNGMRFKAYKDFEEIHSRIYFSIGGGFVVSDEEVQQDTIKRDFTKVPFPFKSAEELLSMCQEHKISIDQLMIENEKAWRSAEKIYRDLDVIWETMKDCISRGCKNTGILPGKLKVKRRAPELFESLISNPQIALKDPLTILDWVNLYALAVNEENASGSRVVTAPTNGAAGIIPAVLKYYEEFCPGSNQKGVHRFLLTAAAIGILYAENASISGAEVGCQGEVGVACSMASGGLVAALEGTNEQIEEAAEIGMEHNLGLTCDPIGGLVQIPCIERNAMGAVKAINAARIAIKRNGKHHVSLDSVIRTMRATGLDMKTKYKETSRGGLAVNVTEC